MLDANFKVNDLPQMPDASRSDLLYRAWEEHIREGLRGNNEMFQRTLKAYMLPNYFTIGMYAILFLVGIGLFAVAARLSLQPEVSITATLFAGLGVATFIFIFITNPLRSLEENLQFMTLLGIVYNTYWTRLLYIQNPETAHAELKDATMDAIQEIERMIDKSAELASARPGLAKIGS